MTLRNHSTKEPQVDSINIFPLLSSVKLHKYFMLKGIYNIVQVQNLHHHPLPFPLFKAAKVAKTLFNCCGDKIRNNNLAEEFHNLLFKQEANPALLQLLFHGGLCCTEEGKGIQSESNEHHPHWVCIKGKKLWRSGCDRE